MIYEGKTAENERKGRNWAEKSDEFSSQMKEVRRWLDDSFAELK